MYNFLAHWHSYPKTLVVPHQINIPFAKQILPDNKWKAKRKEKKNMCNKVKTKKDKFVQCNSERS